MGRKIGALFLLGFLLLIGGKPTGDHVEVVSLRPASNPVPQCMRNLPRLPYMLAAAAAALIFPGMRKMKKAT